MARNPFSLSHESRSISAAGIQDAVGRHLAAALPEGAYEQLAAYVRLLYTWNARMNLTAVRNPQELISLHLAECLIAAQLIPMGTGSALDYGSGAGLPGIPTSIARPEIAMTLGESQKKKAGFLREACRELHLKKTAVYAGRVEDLPAGKVFGAVMLRAVDRMEEAVAHAGARVASGGSCVVLTSEAQAAGVKLALPGFSWRTEPVPGTESRLVLLGMRG